MAEKDKAEAAEAAPKRAPEGPTPASPQRQGDGPARGRATYYIVNPKGTIHSCSREHARERLRQGRGWRMATAAEIKALKEAKGFQRWDRPIAQPWAPDPEEEPDVE